MLVLQTQKRSKADNVVHMRNNGIIPGIVYGALIENTPIQLNRKDFEKIYKEAGESTIIDLDIENKKIPALIHDMYCDPVKGTILHVDFLSVDTNKETTLSIPIEFIGIAPAVKNGLGNLVKVLHEIEIKALPKDIPHAISVDLATLENLESQITAGDISLPGGVKLVTKSSEIIVAIASQKEEKEDTPVDLSNIEVAKKGKKEEAE